MRLIDADEICNECIEETILGTCEGCVIKEHKLNKSIDPESLRPQGEWLKSEDDYCALNIIKCSLCREEWCFEVDDDVETLNYHYCPNCGAKMEGGNT